MTIRCLTTIRPFTYGTIQHPTRINFTKSPNSIEIERLKRQYQEMDVSKLLIERDIDYPQEIGLTENNTGFPPIFQLWDFDDDSFDPRTTNEWLSIGRNSDGKMIGIPSRLLLWITTPNPKDGLSIILTNSLIPSGFLVFGYCF